MCQGASVKRAQSLWVDMAAKLLAVHNGDTSPLSHHDHAEFVKHHDAFTDLWRRTLWTAKTALYSGSSYGWTLLERMIGLAADAKTAGKRKPSVWAWSIVREEIGALRRDYGSGMAAYYLFEPKLLATMK